MDAGIRDSQLCRRPGRSAVTLIEMMIVVGIIGILVSIVMAAATLIQNQSNEQLTRNVLALLESSLTQYHEYEGMFPVGDDPDPNVNSEHLYWELNRVPASRTILARISTSLIQDKVLPGALEIYDPWGTVVNYEYETDVDTFPRLTSAGPDKSFELIADNISNR
jgi:prepilin-type N-terminal cleavage/methylation domain-containing protein